MFNTKVQSNVINNAGESFEVNEYSTWVKSYNWINSMKIK